MDTDTDELLRLAFAQSPANLANSAITRMRAEVGGDGLATSYEVLLPDGNVRAWLLDTLLPRLVDYLESMGAKLPRCGGVFLSVFHGDTLHFLHARDVIALLSRWSGLSTDELKRRYGPR
ncbi:STAUR_1299 family protein [Melittangium boletus]|uniref:STAUR_1299 family protein n=1 Tax=Melittangium boletus TaxID=83453 RepID=UPI003DA66EF5